MTDFYRFLPKHHPALFVKKADDPDSGDDADESEDPYPTRSFPGPTVKNVADYSRWRNRLRRKSTPSFHVSRPASNPATSSNQSCPHDFHNGS